MALEEGEEWNEGYNSRRGSPDNTESTNKRRKTSTPGAPHNKRSKQDHHHHQHHHQHQHQRSSSPPSLEETNEEIAKQYKKFISAPKYDLNSEELFCVCRKPDMGELMVGCDGCEEWFHFECMNENPKFSELISNYYCKFCQWKELGQSLWKRKCRLENCYKPIIMGSKYCSKDHGLQFMKQKLLIDTSTTREDSPSAQELSAGSIKDILNYVADDYDKLLDLGSKFPELKEVVEYKKDPRSLQDFPEDVRNDLQDCQVKYDKLGEQIKGQEQVLETVMEMKDSIKELNEKLTNLIFQDNNQDTNQSLQKKKKKKKAAKGKKKIDLCLCDKSDNFIVKQILDSDDGFDKLLKIIKKRYADDEEEEEEDEENSKRGDEEQEEIDSDWFMGDLCIKDKKKCVRHNGWWNLYHDEAVNNLEQLRVEKKTTSEQKQEILRNYSVKVYES